MGWLQDRKRKKIIEQPFPEEWREILRRDMTVYSLLTFEEQTILENDLRILMAEKDWEGCGGLTLTDEMKVLISAQACLLTLNRPHNYYSNVSSILVYPAAYKSKSKTYQGGGIVNVSKTTRLGESWNFGPVVLSWRDAQEGADAERDGHNVVYHEFAHKLDMLDREMNGVPLLENNEQIEDWSNVMQMHYQALVDAVEAGHNTLLNPYGATNAAEFFAVATECFFEKSILMREDLGDLYRVLKDYYKQDPAVWFERAIAAD